MDKEVVVFTDKAISLSNEIYVIRPLAEQSVDSGMMILTEISHTEKETS